MYCKLLYFRFCYAVTDRAIIDRKEQRYGSNEIEVNGENRVDIELASSREGQ